MVITEWNILFNYTTYLTSPPDNLVQWAVDLTHAQIAVVAHHSQGFIFWDDGQGSRHAPFNVNNQPYVLSNDAIVKFPEGLEGYKAQCAFHAAQMAFYDQHSIGFVALQDLNYLRLFLSIFVVKVNEINIELYPVVTIYENGIITIQHRVLSSNLPVTISEFLGKYLNSMQKEISEIEAPPEIFLHDAHKYLVESADNIKSRLSINLIMQQLKAAVREKTFSTADLDSERDYDHQLVSNNPTEKDSELKQNLQTVTDMILYSILDVVDHTKTDLSYAVSGRKKTKYIRGNFWSMRPAVIILKYKDQENTASEIFSNRKHDILRLLIRSDITPKTSDLEEEIKDYRYYEDFALFDSKAITLYIHSKDSVSDEDINKDQIVLRYLVQTNFVNYILGSFWQLNEVALSHTNSVSDLISIRQKQLMLERIIEYSANNGELIDFYKHSLEIQGLESTRGSLSGTVSIMIEKFKESQNLRRQRFQWSLAMLFGIIAAASNGGVIIKTLSSSVKILPRMTDLQYSGIAVSIVALFLLLFNWIYLKRSD